MTVNHLLWLRGFESLPAHIHMKYISIVFYILIVFLLIEINISIIQTNKLLVLVNKQQSLTTEALINTDNFFLTWYQLQKIPQCIETSTPKISPKLSPKPLGRVFTGTVTCYTSEVAQTDSDPFTTASGHKLKPGDLVVANNYYPFGTKVEIDGIIYSVQDRQASNSPYQFDIWYGDKTKTKDCFLFGKRHKTITIIK